MRLRSAAALGLGLGVLLLVAFIWVVPGITVGKSRSACDLHPATHDTTLPPNFRLEQTPQGDYNPWLQQLTCTWFSDTGEPFTRTYWVGGPLYITLAAIGGTIGMLLVGGALLDTANRFRRQRPP